MGIVLAQCVTERMQGEKKVVEPDRGRAHLVCEGNRKWRVLWQLLAEGHVGKYGQGDVVCRKWQMEKEKVEGILQVNVSFCNYQARVLLFKFSDYNIFYIN